MVAVRILEVVVVEPDGSLRLPSRDQWKAALTPHGPGEYAVVPVEDVRDRTVVQPAKRLFHLGDLGGFTQKDHWSLAERGFRTSDQVRAAGTAKLLAVLGKDVTERLVTSFARLGIPIPDREGSLPTPPGSEEELHAILGEYMAHRDIWAIRKEMAISASGTSGSSFVQHAAGMDVVCGRCGAQHVGVQEKVAATMVCTTCGNDLGLDLAVEVQALRVVLSRSGGAGG